MVFTNREVPVSAAGEHKRVMEKMPHVAEQVSSVVLRANGGKPPVLSVEQSFSGSLCADQLTAKGVSCCRSEITIECVEDRFPDPSQERTRKEERNPNKTRNPVPGELNREVLEEHSFSSGSSRKNSSVDKSRLLAFLSCYLFRGGLR